MAQFAAVHLRTQCTHRARVQEMAFSCAACGWREPVGLAIAYRRICAYVLVALLGRAALSAALRAASRKRSSYYG
jgi:hypothetical protein